MLLTAIYYVDKTVYARALQANQVQDGYDIVSEFPQRHLNEDELGKCIKDYMVVDKNARVALLCLRKHLERQIAEANVSAKKTDTAPMLEALKAVMQAAEIANKYPDL